MKARSDSLHDGFDQGWPDRFRRPALLAIWVVVAAASVLALPRHEGSPLAVLFMSACFAGSMTVLVLRPFTAFFSSLVFFLGMGLWLKFVFHAVTGTALIEPVGSFRSGMWDEVLYVSAAGFLAVTAAMLVDAKGWGRLRIERAAIGSSVTYRKIEPTLAAVSLLVAIACFAGNWYFGFVKYGLAEVVMLPRPLHIAVCFIVLWGAALWLGCMGYWAWSGGRLSMTLLMVLGLFQGLLAGVSNASRARYIFHSMAMGLGWGSLTKDRSARIGPLASVALAVLFVILLAASLILVSLDRIVMYESGESAAQIAGGEAIGPGELGSWQGDGDGSVWSDAISSDAASEMASQISRLFIARWIGLEGIMSVAGYSGKGSSLFLRGITESPTVGNDGLYEEISKSPYVKLPGRLFLTTAGGLAILYYSGSVVVVFFGLFALCLIGVIAERLALRLTESPFAAAVVAVAIANFICQVNQPYVPMVFTFELLIACVLVFGFRVFITRLDRRSRGGSVHAEQAST